MSEPYKEIMNARFGKFVRAWTCVCGTFNFSSSTVCGKCRERRPDAIPVKKETK